MSYDPRNWFPSLACGLSLVAVFLAWCLTEWLYVRLGRDQRRQVCDQGSRGIAMLSVQAGVVLGMVLRGLGWGALSAVLQYLGFVVMAMGIIFRLCAIRVLGRHFSVHVAIQPEHRLITAGPYRWLRHPCYTGTLLTVMGVPAALGIWPLAAFVGVVFL